MDPPSAKRPQSTEAPDSGANGHSVADSVFHLFGSRTGGTIWHAPGDTYVTADHVISAQQELFLEGHDGKWHRMGADIWVDPVHDLAAMTPASPETMPATAALPLSDKDAISPGAKVRGYGFPDWYYSTRPAELPTEYVGRRRNGDLFIEEDKANKELGLADRLMFFLRNDPRFANDNGAAALNRDVVVTAGKTGHGASGGPIVTGAGQVLSVYSRLHLDNTLSTPSDSVADFLAHRDKFEHYAGHYETGVQSYFRRLKDDPIALPISTGIDAVGVLGGANRTFDLTSRLAKTGTVLAGLTLANDTYSNFNKLNAYADTRDTWRNGTALAGDVFMIAGLALSFAPAPLRIASKVLGATGLGTRLTAELIPNHFYVDLPQIPNL